MKRLFVLLMIVSIVLSAAGWSTVTVSAENKTAINISDEAHKVFESLPKDIQEKAASCEAVFVGVEKQPYTDVSGNSQMLKTVWLYYSNLAIEQYAYVDDAMQLFSTGTYELSEGTDFILTGDEKDRDEITIHRDQKYEAGKGLAEYNSTHTYVLNNLGFECVLRK